MKLLPLALLIVPPIAQPALAQMDRVELLSNQPGRAEARVAGIELHGDQATIDRDTGELQMRGHVHILLPARADHTAVRYGTRVIVTAQPIGLTADRVTVKDGLLQASGNIVVAPVEDKLAKMQLHGDEMSMFLKIGDATLRGNVRLTGFLHTQSGSGAEFPPEIIKP